MSGRHEYEVHKINCLTSDMNALYHRAALKLGLSDSTLVVMYMLHYKGDGCLLHEICRESGVSKQTINSSLRKLEEEGSIFLKLDKGKNKRIFLTETGKERVKQTGARIFEAECNAFTEWDKSDIELFLKLMEKYNHSLSRQIDGL